MNELDAIKLQIENEIAKGEMEKELEFLRAENANLRATIAALKEEGQCEIL